MSRTLPVEPILEAIAARQLVQPHRGPYMGEWRALYRARAKGEITLGLADRIACRLLRVHPAAIYGPDWWKASE